MADVVEHLYNKPYKGKVIIDDTLKAAIDAYYEQYGAERVSIRFCSAVSQRSEEIFMEKVYKTMQRTGACSIAVGVIILVTGVTVGIMSIVCGGLLLKRKGEITF